jgi:hypothetical protein
MLMEKIRVIRPAMFTTAEADGYHAGRYCSLNSCCAVFDDNAMRWRNAHSVRSMKKEVWRWLATRNHRRAEQMRLEPTQQTHNSQAGVNPLQNPA